MIDTPTLDSARAQQQALAALARPIARNTGPRHDYGDGDTCPLDAGHGRMYVLKGSSPAIQWCAHSDHEKRKGKDGMPDRPRTRSKWPSGIDSFPDAVAEHRLKEADNA